MMGDEELGSGSLPVSLNGDHEENVAETVQLTNTDDQAIAGSLRHSLKGDDEEVATETNPLDIASLTDHDEDLIGAKLLPDDVDHGDSGSIDIAGLQREPR